MEKFIVTFDHEGEIKTAKFVAYKHSIAEEKVVEAYIGATNIQARTLKGYLDDNIRAHIQKLKFSERVESDQEYKAQIRERLRSCADLAYILGEESQESLEHVMERMVECKWEITGLDSCMFSFGIKYSFGYGAMIFHQASKTWATHS